MPWAPPVTSAAGFNSSMLINTPSFGPANPLRPVQNLHIRKDRKPIRKEIVWRSPAMQTGGLLRLPGGKTGIRSSSFTPSRNSIASASRCARCSCRHAHFRTQQKTRLFIGIHPQNPPVYGSGDCTPLPFKIRFPTMYFFSRSVSKRRPTTAIPGSENTMDKGVRRL
jgi:hypothetical protein